MQDLVLNFLIERQDIFPGQNLREELFCSRNMYTRMFHRLFCRLSLMYYYEWIIRPKIIKVYQTSLHKREKIYSQHFQVEHININCKQFYALVQSDQTNVNSQIRRHPKLKKKNNNSSVVLGDPPVTGSVAVSDIWPKSPRLSQGCHPSIGCALLVWTVWKAGTDFLDS